MNRRNLILRRHGAMTFGLGYYQDGVWVDHLAADHAGVHESADGRAAQEEGAAIDVVHQWFSCCADPLEPELRAADRDATVPAVGVILHAVAGTAER